tara:strand:+ start:1920 stop:2804 length:885 start_codon:yes stop_codon:yes gene_type:complete
MKEVPQKTVDSILENVYFGYGKKATLGHPNVDGGTTNVNLGNGNKWDVPTKTGKGTGQDQGNQGKGSGDGGVTADQTAGYDAASKAGPGNDTFSHEAEQMPGQSGKFDITPDPSNMNASDPTKGGAGSTNLGYTADGGNTGVNLGNGNKWEMPSSQPAGSGQDKGVEDSGSEANIKVFPAKPWSSQEAESMNKNSIKDHQEISMDARVQKLEEAIVTILEKVTAIHNLEEAKSGREDGKDIPWSAKDAKGDEGNQQNGYPKVSKADKAVGANASNAVGPDYGQPGTGKGWKKVK